jgi:hypothetical protein
MEGFTGKAAWLAGQEIYIFMDVPDIPNLEDSRAGEGLRVLNTTPE